MKKDSDRIIGHICERYYLAPIPRFWDYEPNEIIVVCLE